MSKKTDLTILHSMIAIEIEEKERKSDGGIFLPDSHEVLSMEGVVIDLGLGNWIENEKTGEMERETFQVKVNDRVIFSPNTTFKLEIGDRVIHLLEEKNILGIVV